MILIRVTFLTMATLILSVTCAQGDRREPMTKSSELLKKGDELFDNKDQASALEIYRQAAVSAEESGNNSDLTEAFSQIARCYLSLDRKDEGIPYLTKAEGIASVSEPYGWSRFLSVRGRYEWKKAASEAGELAPIAEKAATTFKEMYDYCLKHELHGRAIDAANMVAITGGLEERIDWGIKAIKAAEEGGLENWLAVLWNNLGWAYDDLGRYDESLDALKRARRYHYIKGQEQAMLIADWSVGHAFRMTGQIDSALTWTQEVMKWALYRYTDEKTPDNAEWLGLSFLELGEVVLADGDRSRALKCFKSAKRYLSEAGMQDWDPRGFEELKFRIDNFAK